LLCAFDLRQLYIIQAECSNTSELTITLCERDSSGTTEGHEMPEGDGADSPTQAGKAREAARPNLNKKQVLNVELFKYRK
jgi:hypothetical protein